MNRYTTNGDGVITRADSVHDAADVIARRLCGPDAVCARLRHDGRTADGRDHTYEAVVEHPSGGAIATHNVWIYECRAA